MLVGAAEPSQDHAVSLAMNAQAARLQKLAVAAEPEPEPEPEPEQLQMSAEHRSFERAAPLQPALARGLALEAQRMELWHLARNEVASTRDSVVRQLQLASDMLREFRVRSRVPEPDDEGRILAVGGSPLVKLEHEVAHGEIKGACIVENAAVTGAEFKMRLNRVKVRQGSVHAGCLLYRSVVTGCRCPCGVIEEQCSRSYSTCDGGRRQRC